MRVPASILRLLQEYHTKATEEENGLVVIDQSKGRYDRVMSYLGFTKLKPDTWFLDNQGVNQAINLIDVMARASSLITKADKKRGTYGR